jgi:hypothetical protein
LPIGGIQREYQPRVRRENVAHRVSGAPVRRVVVIGVPVEGEGGSGVSGEGLEISDRRAALGK